MSHISQVQVEERAERGRRKEVGETVHGEDFACLGSRNQEESWKNEKD